MSEDITGYIADLEHQETAKKTVSNYLSDLNCFARWFATSAQLNITHYEHFGLRDAHSANPDLFHQFGLMRDDYTPKPAFETYRQLIAELGTH